MPLRHGFRRFALCALVSVSTGAAALAYDSPDFTVELFSRDGILLSGEDRANLLEALSSLALGFPGHARVDDDLREKALALALGLDPLHLPSREAHRVLSAGTPPPATGPAADLGEVSEVLWTVGSRLAADPPDPEERRLAPYVLEIALLLDPEPPADRLAALALASGREAPAWDEALSLQREGNPSTARARDLHRDAVAALKEKRAKQRAAEMAQDLASVSPTNPANLPNPSNPTNPPVPPNRPPDRRPSPPAPIESLTASLAAVRWVSGDESSACAGTVTLTIRSPATGPERLWLAVRQSSPDSIPLRPSDFALPLEALDLPPTVLEGRTWTWPEGALGELAFEASQAPPGPRRRYRTTARLPARILLEAILAKRPLNPSFVVLGEIEADTGQWVLEGDPVATVEAALELDRPYLLVPASALEPLVTYLQASDRLDLLFRSEWITADGVAGAVSRMTRLEDPALAIASVDFDLIEAAAASMPLPELARLPSAQERLQAILDAYPDHLSARAMLEFGRRPLSLEIRIERTVSQIDAIVAPFRALERGEEGIAAPVDTDLFDEIGTQFLKLRTAVPVETRDLLGAAEDLVEAAERYLELTNRGTSIAIQRLREARAALAAYDGVRARFAAAPQE